MRTFNETKNVSGPKISPYHPVIPKLYTTEWKLDTKNLKAIIKNCQLAGVTYDPIETVMFLERRERLNARNEPRVQWSTKEEIPRVQMLKPPIHSHLAKYRSSLMFRW